MFLTEYLSHVTKVINEYSNTGLILKSEVILDSRTEKIGLIRGTANFINESKLFFTEYLDLSYTIEKLSYHYQDRSGNLIFRYDNAKHRPALKFRDHKHIKGSIVQSEPPDFKDILEEIILSLLDSL